jgi:hypothetical protein
MIEKSVKKFRIKKAVEDNSIVIGFLTTKEICAVLDISELKLNRLYAAEEIKPVIVGGFTFWDVVEVDLALYKYKQSSAPDPV